MVDFAKDHNISLALAQAIMLSKDVDEGLEEIRDLLVMQQDQVSNFDLGYFSICIFTLLIFNIFLVFVL